MESSILSYPHDNPRHSVLLLLHFRDCDKEKQSNQLTGPDYTELE